MTYSFSIANFKREFDKDDKGTGAVSVSGFILLKIPDSTINYFNIPTYSPAGAEASQLNDEGFAGLFREVGASSRTRTNLPGEAESTTAVAIPKYFSFNVSSPSTRFIGNSWQIPVDTGGKVGLRSLRFPAFFTVGMTFQWLCTAIKANFPSVLISPSGKRYPFYKPQGTWASGVGTGLNVGAWCSTTPQAWSGSFADIARAKKALQQSTPAGAVQTGKGGG